MIEDLEGVSSVTNDTQKLESVSEIELEFIGECLCPPRPDELADRVDAIYGGNPPKSIDSIPDIASLIEPIKDVMPTKYLEAPSDLEQVEQISDVMSDTKGLKYEEWVKLSPEQRLAVLNELEQKIAVIEHRPTCPISMEDMGNITKCGNRLSGSMGYHLPGNFLCNEEISINSKLIESNDPVFHKEVLNTVIHEGRHSYQDYNINCRSNHTSSGDLTNWSENMHKYGYQSAEKYGFKAYWMQPVEADARKFAEDVINAYTKKI